jgi:hypothetical protein
VSQPNDRRVKPTYWKKRILLFVGLAIALVFLELCTADWFHYDSGWEVSGEGVVRHILNVPPRYWRGKEWLSLIASVAAAVFIVRSTRPSS